MYPLESEGVCCLNAQLRLTRTIPFLHTEAELKKDPPQKSSASVWKWTSGVIKLLRMATSGMTANEKLTIEALKQHDKVHPTFRAKKKIPSSKGRREVSVFHIFLLILQDAVCIAQLLLAMTIRIYWRPSLWVGKTFVTGEKRAFVIVHVE